MGFAGSGLPNGPGGQDQPAGGMPPVPPVPAPLDALALPPVPLPLVPLLPLPLLVTDALPPPAPAVPPELFASPSPPQEHSPTSSITAAQRCADLDNSRLEDKETIGKRSIPRLSHKAGPSARPKTPTCAMDAAAATRLPRTRTDPAPHRSVHGAIALLVRFVLHRRS